MKLTIFLALLIFGSFSSAAGTGDISGHSIAIVCAGCHGTDGTLNKPGLPRLKGEPAAQMYESLIDFKYDKARSTIMGRITKGYTDAELKSVAKYFSSLKN